MWLRYPLDLAWRSKCRLQRNKIYVSARKSLSEQYLQHFRHYRAFWSANLRMHYTFIDFKVHSSQHVQRADFENKASFNANAGVKSATLSLACKQGSRWSTSARGVTACAKSSGDTTRPDSPCSSPLVRVAQRLHVAFSQAIATPP